ncbi:MAG: hypothetical protein Q8K45_15000 [Rubrivivax sp.]|nr:hypothetical protein [Rubrivivax sp.]
MTAEPGNTGHEAQDQAWRGSRWRAAAWGGVAGLFLLPLAAKLFTDNLGWDAADFALFGAMLLGVGGCFDLAARKSRHGAYRAAVGVALASAFLLLWVNAAVGLIGSEDHPANTMFGGVLAIALVGAVSAGFRPQGMARAMVATAIAQAAVAVIALAALDAGWRDTLLSTGIFATLWLLSAWLFRRSGAAPAAADPAL